MRSKQVVVIGSSDETEFLKEAFSIGEHIAIRGYTLISGGRGGIMEAASRGAASAGGIVVGILPGERLDRANPYCSIVIPTGMGYARNVINILSADIIIAIGGKSGTLSELAYAWTYGKTIICCTFAGGWGAEFPRMHIDDREGSVILTPGTVEETCRLLDEYFNKPGYC